MFRQVFQALSSLEYRGYDSFGFGATLNGGFHTAKRVGPVSDSTASDFGDFDLATTLVAHTRWATHGGVSERNCHPHVSSDGVVCIVHNGVIANFSELASALRGSRLSSDTDTEVGANVIAAAIAASPGRLESALADAMSRMDGEFAICGLLADRPDWMFALKRKSPLAIAMLADGVACSSDRDAFSAFAGEVDVVQLADDQLCIYREGVVELFQVGPDGRVERIAPTMERIRPGAEETDKAGHSHYMIKEIHEAPRAVVAVAEMLAGTTARVVDEMVASEVTMTGSGSAYYVTVIGQYLFQAIAGAYIPTHPSDEYANLRQFSRRDLLLAVSQSGETFDTLEVVRAAKERGALVVAINNVASSTMQRLADVAIYQNAGREICVLSTKSIVSQAAAFYLLAVELGTRTGRVGAKDATELRDDLTRLPDALRAVIAASSGEIKRIATENCRIEHWFFIGRGPQYAIALESALKFKEVSYLHAEGMPAGFFKHGTISLIDDHFYTVVFLPSAKTGHLYQATIDNVHEIRARGGNVIGIGHDVPSAAARELFLDYIQLPDVNPHLNLLTQLVCGQLLAYHCALSLGRNIDRPRSLAKSVTVR
jgi:glucosamine--fructose-6-phosphate aminotransferase (isomerizing)